METSEKPIKFDNAERNAPRRSTEFLLQNGLICLNESSVEELCFEKGIKPKDLPSYLQKIVKKAVKFITKNSGDVNNDLDREINFAYKCWFATRTLRPDDSLFEFARDIASFDSFVHSYAPRISKEVQGNLMRRINRFIDRRVHPSRILTLYKEEEFSGVYQYGGQWVSFPFLHDPHELAPARYVELGVIKELTKILENEYPTIDLFHETGSAALGGIGQHGAILSSKRLHELKEEIKTGENAWYARELDRPLYASEKLKGYRAVRWFDEFPVVFGLSYNKVRTYLQMHKKYLGSKYYGSEGMEIGNEIPLNLLEVVFTNFLNIPELSSWAQRHCPGAKVISIEAQMLLEELLSYREKYGIHSSAQETISLWRNLLTKKAVVLSKKTNSHLSSRITES